MAWGWKLVLMSPVNCLFLAKPLLSNLIGTGLKKAVKKWLPFFASIRDECDNRWSLTKTRYKNGSTRSHHKEINLRHRVKLACLTELRLRVQSPNTQQAQFLLYTHTHLCSRSHTIWLYYTSSREIIFLYYMASFPSLLCTTNNRLGLSKNTEYSTLKVLSSSLCKRMDCLRSWVRVQLRQFFLDLFRYRVRG